MPITVCFRCKKILTMTSLPSTLTAKILHEDKLFDRQDILQFFSGVSKDYKYVKSPKHEIGTLKAMSHEAICPCNLQCNLCRKKYCRLQFGCQTYATLEIN